MEHSNYLDCEVYLPADSQARLSIGRREFAGRPVLDENLERRLLATADPTVYGTLLFEALFTAADGELSAGYKEALALASESTKRLRLRLHIANSAPARLHRLLWELLYDPKRRLALGLSREIAFSRYLSSARRVQSVAVQPRLLAVVANPENLSEHQLTELDEERIRRSLDLALSPLETSISWEFLKPPATLDRIRDRMLEGGFHALHLQAQTFRHKDRSNAQLVLEDDNRDATFVNAELFAEILLGQSELSLLTLIACHDSTPMAIAPFSDLGPSVVRRGITAVIATQRPLSITAAGRFSEHFYYNLIRSGRVDAAINEARLHLYLANPQGFEWGSPALFMSLSQGQLWQQANYQSPNERQLAEQLTALRADEPQPLEPKANLHRSLEDEVVWSATTNPYVGPRPFEIGETLYGRDTEIAELYYLLSAERVVLLHSPSGAGKSSLVQAGLIPRLRQRFDVWRPTRINQLSTQFSQANRFVLSAIQGFEEGIPKEHRRPLRDLAKLSLAEYMATRPRRPAAPTGIVLVFDQFEEILTIDPLELEIKHEFFDQLGELLRNPQVRALLVLREDFLASLESYAEQIPTHLRSRFRLELLDLEAAQEAIVGPALKAGKELATPAIDKLVQELAMIKIQQVDGSFVEQPGRHVEPVQLQVVCRKLWEQVPVDEPSINLNHLERFGDVPKALADYYASSVSAASADQIASQRSIRDWFRERLITESGIRGQVVRGTETSGGLNNKVIERLLDTHLIRAEKRGGATWYELAHDRLVQPISRNNEAWCETHLNEVQKRASLWEIEGQLQGLLFEGEELWNAERWAADHLSELTDSDRRFLAASRKAEQVNERERRQARRIRGLAIVSTIVAVAALAASIIAGVQWLRAAQQQKVAEKHRQEAENERLETEKQRQLAEDLRQVAEEREQVAVNHEQRARNLARAAITSNLLADDQNTAGNLLILEVPSPDKTPEAVVGLHNALAVPVEVDVLTLTHPIRYSSPHSDSQNLKPWWFSPDGERLLTLEDVARLWNARTGEQIAKLEGYTGGAVFSPGGELIATSDGSTTMIWSVDTGKRIAILEGHALLFSPDSTRLVTVSSGTTARIWNVRTGEQVTVFARHTTPVQTASFSQDSNRILTTSRNHTVRIWKTHTGEEIAVLGPEKFVNSHGHKMPVDAMFTPDNERILTIFSNRVQSHKIKYKIQLWKALTGELVATMAATTRFPSFSDRFGFMALRDYRTVKIWDVWRGEEIATIEHEQPCQWSSFTPNLFHIVTVCGQKPRLWDARTAQLIATAGLIRNPFDGVTFSPGGDRILTFERPGARIRQTVNGEEMAHLTGAHDQVASFSLDGERVLTGNRDTAKIWNVRTGEQIAVLKGHQTSPSSNKALESVFSPDRKRIVTVSASSHSTPYPSYTVRIWVVNEGEQIITIGSETLAASFSPDGSRIVTGSMDSTARIWNASTGNLMHTLRGHTKPIHSVSFNPDGSRIVTTSSDKSARIWNAQTGKELATLKQPVDNSSALGGGLAEVSFSPDGSRVVGVFDESAVWIWNAQTGETIATLGERMRAASGVSFSPDGERIIGTGQSVQIWNAQTTEEVISLKGQGSLMGHRPWFSPDGSRVVTTDSRSVQIWNAQTGEQVITLTGYLTSFSPDSTQIVTAYGSTARIWNTQTGGQVAILEGHKDQISALSFNPNGTLVATASKDKTVRIWNTQTGEELVALHGHQGGPSTASFSPDGSRILTVGDGTARLWAIPNDYPTYLQSRIRARTRLCLDADFRQNTLDESIEEAERNAQACEQCVPVYFERLGDAPLWEWQIYMEAWKEYQACLDRH